jgi:hypothetical protein
MVLWVLRGVGMGMGMGRVERVGRVEGEETVV